MTWEHDHFPIDLDRVDWEELNGRVNPGWQQSQHGYTREDFDQWLDDYRQVEQLRQRGATIEHFESLRDSPDPNDRRLWEAYSYSYDPHHEHSDRVTVNWTDGRYQVGDGSHRLQLARERGLTHLPATVYAPDRATLDRLKVEDGGRPKAFPAKEPSEPEQDQVARKTRHQTR